MTLRGRRRKRSPASGPLNLAMCPPIPPLGAMFPSFSFFGEPVCCERELFCLNSFFGDVQQDDGAGVFSGLVEERYFLSE